MSRRYSTVRCCSTVIASRASFSRRGRCSQLVAAIAGEPQVVEFADFDERTFSAQAVDIEALTGSTLPPSREFDPKGFSVGEFWFYSV
jgi:hypothetical protein